jgi:DNA-binding IclR family transcriptional regulator
VQFIPVKINSVDKAITILNCFSVEEAVLSVGAISKMTGITLSTASRLLSTMERRGVVEKAGGHGRYHLGYRTYFWGLLSRRHNNLATLARPMMEQLRDSSGEEVSLYIVTGNHRTCLERVASKHAIAMTGSIGGRLPLHAGASGRVLLAYMPPDRQEQVLESTGLDRFTEHTLTDPDRLRAELRKIREQGVGISREEREPGAYSVVAPIRDADGQVVASLTIAGPLYRLSDGCLGEHIADVKRTAAAISNKLAAA